MRLYLENIIDDIPFESLPAKWQGFDFSRFSKDKTLFDFQKQALQNALKGLWLYYYPSAKGWAPKTNGIVEENNSPSVKGWQSDRIDGVVYEGGGFFKYCELEQYEEALANCKYKDSDLFTVPGHSPYQEYVFMKDEKMLKVLEIDYENDKVKVDLSKLSPNTPSAHSPFQKGWQAKPDGVFADTPLQKGNIDIAETLSNLIGKWIKKINTPSYSPFQKGWQAKPDGVFADTPLKEGNCEVEFEDGTKINTKDLDYKLIKPLIWWE